MKNNMTDQQGRSMIEMLGVLAIVGVLSVAGIQGYSKAMGKYKANKVMDQVSTIAANTKTLFASVGSYSGVEEASKPNLRALKLKLIPEEMTKTCDSTLSNAETCVLNGLNGETTIAAGSGGLSFTIKMDGLTKEACVAVLTSDWGGASGFKGITLTGQAAVTPGTSGFSAAKSCADNDNEVTWEFY